MKALQLFFLVTVTALAVTATPQPEYIQQAVEIHRLLPQTGSSGHRIQQIDCLSWRLAVETNNVRDWKLFPSKCENYVGHYMLGKHYRDGCEIVADAAVEYANSLTLADEGKDIWVFDIDETTLSNLPYYARSDVAFGGVNETGSGVVFKSGKRTELVKDGYRIVGNMGDQWSDLIGLDAGDRTFKVPDPMYYIA